MKKIIVALMVLCFTSVCFAEKNKADVGKKKKSGKMSVAVMALQNLGVKKGLELSVTDILTTEMVNTGKFDVVERMQVAKVLNEQGFQQAGVTDPSKASEVGKLVNVEHVLIGTLNKLGKKFIVNVKIVNVRTGKISYAKNANAHNEDYLIAASKKIVRKLLHAMTGSYDGKKKAKKARKKKGKKDDMPGMPGKKKDRKDPVKNKAGNSFNELDDM